MSYQGFAQFKRNRLSTSGSYHSALDESDYENDIEELEEQEEELACDRNFNELSHFKRRKMNRPLFTLTFLSGITVALVAMLLSDYVRNVFNRAQDTHIELLPDVAHLNLGSDTISELSPEENWTKTQVAKQKEKYVTKPQSSARTEG